MNLRDPNAKGRPSLDASFVVGWEDFERVIRSQYFLFPSQFDWRFGSSDSTDLGPGLSD